MRRRCFLAGLATASVLPHNALAYSAQNYTPVAWKSLRESADRIVLNFHAEWSLTCRIKRDLLEELLAEHPEFAALTFVDVDWDTYGPSEFATRRLKVERRSTLVALKGGEEVARVVNEPYKERLHLFLDSVLAA